MNGKIKFGTCSWHHEEWHGLFYPQALPPSEWLAFYAGIFSAVEIGSTFHTTPSAATLAHWFEATPADFSLSCKMPRAITHQRKLRDCEDLVQGFLDNLSPLRTKLGPILIQLPRAFQPDQDEFALREFLFKLPRNYSFAVEFPHADWHLPRIIKLLEEQQICWVWSDVTSLLEQKRAPFEFLPQTADCLYIRLLGNLKNRCRNSRSLHQSAGVPCPRDFALENWAIKIEKHLSETNCAHIFAGNHYEGLAPQTAQRLACQLGLQICLPLIPEENEQLHLF